MSEEPRMLQAADVYNATHDLRLYEWVARLESQNQALQERIEQFETAWEVWAGHCMNRHNCDWGYTEHPALSPTQETDPE